MQMRWVGTGTVWFVLCALCASIGCGKTKGPSSPAPEDGSAGQSGAGSAGQSDAGSADAGSSGAIATPPLAPGACGILRAFDLPEPEVGASAAAVARQAGGFSVGPWKSGSSAEQVHGALLDATGLVQQRFSAGGGVNDNNWSLFLAAPQLAVDVHFGAGATLSGEVPWNTRVWSNGDVKPSERGTLVQAQWRGTDTVIVRPSLDGESAVLSVWPSALSEPRAALMGPDAQRMGESHSLAPADHLYSSCQSVLPTLHGGVISFVDPAVQALRIVELLSDGTAAYDVSWPLPSGSSRCPVWALDGTGVAFLFDPSVGDATPPNVMLGRVDARGNISTEPMPLSQGALAFTSLGSDWLVLEGDVGLERVGVTGSKRFMPSLGITALEVVPAEAGSIYLDEGPYHSPRRLIELGCAPD